MLWALLIIVSLAALVLSLRGAPYVPTLKREVQNALDLAELKPGMTVVDLGSGDGRLLLAAARRGCRAVGYEINPLLVLYSRLRTYSVRKQVRIDVRDFWLTPLPDDTDVVFVFLAKPFMRKLESHLERESARLGRPLTLISFGFELPSHSADDQRGATYLYRIG